jgi:hypothetical protein
MPTNAVFQPARATRHQPDQRVQVRVQRGEVHRARPRAGWFREHHPELERFGRQHRHRRPGGDVGTGDSRRSRTRQQRRQRPLRALRSVLPDLRRHRETMCAAATSIKIGATRASSG